MYNNGSRKIATYWNFVIVVKEIKKPTLITIVQLGVGSQIISNNYFKYFAKITFSV